MQILSRLRLPLFFIGAVLFFVMERYFSGHEKIVLFRILALGLMAVATLLPLLASRGMMGKTDDCKRWIYPVFWQGGILLSFALYLLYVKLLGSSGEPGTLATKALLAVWLILLIVGLFSAAGIEFGLATAGFGKYSEPKRVQKSALTWTAIGILMSALVAFNFVASKKNRSYDWSYLKTSTPSETTYKILENLKEPLDIAVFFPASNEVLVHVKDYFEPIAQKGGKVKVEYFDKDINPAAAEKYQTTRNGQVVLFQKGNFERLDLGQNLASARKTLRTLDQEFQKTLLTLTTERKVAYFSSGHGELSWRSNANSDDPLKSIRLLETFLRNQNYTMRFWGAGEGSLKEVPRDASVLVIARNTQPFLEEEVNAIRAYVNQGGSLMVFLDLDGPDENSLQITKGRDFEHDPLIKYLESIGVRYKPTPLANNSNFVNGTHSPIDAWFLFTNNFASHDSIPSLNKNDERIAILTFKSGYFSVTSEFAGWQNFEVIRSLSDTYNDDNKDFKFTEKTQETRAAYPIGTASIQKKDPKTPDKKLGHVVAFADASAISDAILKNPGNLIYFADSLKWLAGDSKTQGALSTEEDVRIRHTRNEDLVWFYGSVVAVPILVLVAGYFATRRTKRGVA